MNPKTIFLMFFFYIDAGQALAHARFKVTGTLKPRSIESGLKTPPCGDIAVDETRRVSLTKGQTLKVEWEETINHTGLFKIFFSQDGENGFGSNPIKEIQDDQNGSIVYADPNSWHQFSTEIQVPDVLCDKCTFQLIQVMTDTNPPSMYYSCADVKITAPPAPSTSASNPGTSTNTATSTNVPKPPTNLEIVIHRKASTTQQSTRKQSAGDNHGAKNEEHDENH